MDTAIIQRQYHLKHCVPLSRLRISNTNNPNPFCNLGFWVSKVSEGICLKSIDYSNSNDTKDMPITDSAFHASPEDDEEDEEELQVKTAKMEGLIQKKKEATGKFETFGNLIEDKGRDSSGSSDFLSSETSTRNEEQSRSSTESSSSSSSSPPSVGWPAQKIAASNSPNPRRIRLEEKKKQNSVLPEIEMMKERFARLLLGEDMSGCGNGVPTALAISNAITNLCGTLFGQILRLEPVAEAKKAMWHREMEWLLSVSDHIVELAPTCQTCPDGSKVEVMSCRPRTDLYVNLPALRKLDNMLLEILESFVNTEFWYVDRGAMAGSDGSESLSSSSSASRGRGRGAKREEEKWWLPVPRVPPCGLRQSLRKKLQHKRDCTSQILKAAQAINTITLADMDIPDSYVESLPKTARACLGDVIYGHITSDQFSAECVLDCLDLSSEHQAMEIANKVEASVYIWRKRINFNSKPCSSSNSTGRHSTKTSWEMVKDLMVDGDKWEVLAERAESIMLCLRRRFPGLPQTSLDMSKIQHNKDVGKGILESYSRVLESLAFNIVARIDDVLYVDDLTKYSGNHFPVPIPSTPSRASISTPTLTPARTFSPLKAENNTPIINSSSTSNFGQRGGGGVKRILTDYLSIDVTKGDNQRNSVEKIDPTSKTFQQLSAFEKELESK